MPAKLAFYKMCLEDNLVDCAVCGGLCRYIAIQKMILLFLPGMTDTITTGIISVTIIIAIRILKNTDSDSS